MGCVCSQRIEENGYAETQRDRGLNRSSRRLVAPSRREDVVAADSEAIVESDGGRTRLISETQENVIALATLSPEKKKGALAVDDRSRKDAGLGWRAMGVIGTESNTKVGSVAKDGDARLGIVSVPNGFEAAYVAAGWPSWLVAAAGEAIKGWLPRRADSFEKLDKIGQGTYSNVYRARDLETGKTVALKKVRFVNMDPESVRFMAREIQILRRLDHPNIVKLEGLVTSRMSSSLYLVFEYMEHDLAGLAATPGIKFMEPQVKCYMQQLLRGLDHCHTHGVLHRDIKGSNLLIDNNGILRIADFGLATFFNPNQKQTLTSRVVTLWYRPPELLLGATEYGVAVDLWSAGCILAELLAGKPIMPGRTEVEQLHQIFKLCGSPSEGYWRKSKLPHATIFKPQIPYPRCVSDTFRDFPPSALALLDSLLAIEPEDRGTAVSALESDFFTSKPLACDPSSLPKYPPSKEFDAKLRDEEARRQRAAALKGHGSDSGRRPSRESRAMPIPDANAGMQVSLQKRQVPANLKSSSQKYTPQEDGGSGFPIDPPRAAAYGSSHYGQQMHPGVVGSSWNKNVQGDEILAIPGHSTSTLRVSSGQQLRTQRSFAPHAGVANLSNLSGLVAARSSANSRYSQLDVAKPSEKLLERPSSSHKKDDRGGKESTVGYGTKKNRIHYSGPLMPPRGNVEEMMKEYERQMQQAVHKARVNKTKAQRAYGERAQFEALLFPGRNGSLDA